MHDEFINELEKLKGLSLENETDYLPLTESIQKILKMDEQDNLTRTQLKLKNSIFLCQMIKENKIQLNLLEQMVLTRICELIRIFKIPLVVLTVIKNTIGKEPNYNLVPKIKSEKGFKFNLFLEEYFKDNKEDVTMILHTVEILNQIKKITIEELIVSLIKIAFLNYYSRFEIKTKSWNDSFMAKEGNSDNIIEYIIEFLKEDNV